MPKGQHNAEKTECPKGHALSGDNLRVSQCATGLRRVCKQCARDTAARRYAERKKSSRA